MIVYAQWRDVCVVCVHRVCCVCGVCNDEKTSKNWLLQPAHVSYCRIVISCDGVIAHFNLEQSKVIFGTTNPLIMIFLLKIIYLKFEYYLDRLCRNLDISNALLILDLNISINIFISFFLKVIFGIPIYIYKIKF